jgi:hypothetical protein
MQNAVSQGTTPGTTIESRCLRIFFYIAAAVFTLLTLIRIYVGWKDGVSLTEMSGTWIGMADDMKHNVFYRPLSSSLGIGGTRYFPLHFVLQGELMKMGLGPEASGHVLEGIVCLALLLAMYRILRMLRAGPLMAACIPVLILGTRAGQIAILSVRGDLLPLTLNVLGLAVCIGAGGSSGANSGVSLRRVLGASLFFTLAFASKPTSLYGVAAVVVSFALARQFRQAVQMMLATAAGCAAVIGVIALGTGGSFFVIYRACGLAAGYSLMSATSTSFWPAFGLPLDLLVLVLGFCGFCALPGARRLQMPAVFFLFAAAATFAVVGAVGAGQNHFIDVEVAALIVFSAWLFDEQTNERKFGVAALAMLTVASSYPMFIFVRHRERDFAPYAESAYEPSLRQTVQFLGAQQKPILAENTLVPLLAGQRPYLLDLWMFTVRAEGDPALANSMSKAIKEHQFGAIVLTPYTTLSADNPYFFPKRLTEEMRQNYVLAKQFPRADIYLPRTQ